MMLLSLAPTAAAVTWEHTLTDPAGDVISVLAPTVPVSGREEVDILSASIKEQGDDLNVTLSLAGARNTEANYQVTVTCDDDDAKDYSFTYSFGLFTIVGFDLVEDDPTAYLSADNTLISWIVARDKISATEKVEVTHAEAQVFAGITNYVDTAPDEGNGGNGGNGGGGDGEPVNMQVHVEIRKVTHVRQTIEVVLDGEDSKDLRGEFDLDVDGTVTKAEYDQHIEFFYLLHASWNSTSMKLDGMDPESKAMTFEFAGVIGSSTSTSPVTQVVVLDIRFPDVDEAQSHTYAGDLAGGDDAGDMWDVTADSLWQMSAPSGWKFKTGAWPEDLKTYVGSGGTTVVLSGLQMQTSWNDTMGTVNSVVITEKEGGGGEDEEESPGFGFAIVIAGLMVAVLVAVVSKGRG
jgi:hypothetical protein